MNVTELQVLIEAAIAQMVRAQQKTAPALDLCYPRMMNAQGYADMRAAGFDIALSIAGLLSAIASLKHAAKMIGDFTSKETQ